MNAGSRPDLPLFVYAFSNFKRHHWRFRRMGPGDSSKFAISGPVRQYGRKHPDHSMGRFRVISSGVSARGASHRILTASDRQNKNARRHSTIGYLSPLEFERKVGLA
jgi:hypothetical protein